MKQVAYIIISSTPSLKNIAQISSHSFWPDQAISIIFHIHILHASDNTLQQHDNEINTRDPELVYSASWDQLTTNLWIPF